MALTRVKMCGMTNADDINAAVKLGAHAIGLVFYEKSPRCVSLPTAKSLASNLPPLLGVIAVVVNPSSNKMQKIIETIPAITSIQFHGDESASFCEQFSKPYIKALPATSYQSIIDAAQEHPLAQAILVDTPSLKHGGSGQTFDWSLIPQNLTQKIILAGGLTAANVNQAIAIVQPYAVDVCSGIEKKPGAKDLHKMTEFMGAVNQKNEGEL